MFIFTIIHIWFLGAMPMISLGILFFSKSSGSEFIKAAFSETILVLILIAGIIGIFLIFAFCFIIGEIYMEKADRFFFKDRKKTISYLSMVLGPFLYFGLIHLFSPKILKFEVIETGIITLISQHFIYHLVFFIIFFKRIKKLKNSLLLKGIKILSYFINLFIFLLISLKMYLDFYFFESSSFWFIAFNGFLFSSVISSFLFFYYSREILFKLRYGDEY